MRSDYRWPVAAQERADNENPSTMSKMKEGGSPYLEQGGGGYSTVAAAKMSEDDSMSGL
ncbi:hypothetical protein WAI453_011619 [Rhynchosporium graminicola]